MVVLLGALLLLPAQAPAAVRIAEGDQPLISGNVEPLATIPLGKPIGARFRDDLMYVTGTDGVSIYDVSQPALPVSKGALPLPHFENEDVDMGGDILLVSNDPSEGVGILYVIDVSNPSLPRLRGALANDFIDDAGLVSLLTFGVVEYPLEPGTGHTVSCVKPDCSWAYMAGTSHGITIVDLRNPDQPRVAGKFKPDITGLATHDVQMDKQGLAWIVGAEGTAAYDVTDPLKPRRVARSDENIKNSGQLGVPTIPVFEIGGDGENPIDLIHHNSLRLGETGGGHQGTKVGGVRTRPFRQVPGKTYPAGGNSPFLGITEEDYNRPTCKGAGEFQTWGIGERARNGTLPVALLDRYQTELNALVEGRGWAPVTGLCSAHYFDYRDGIIAQGWYEEGTRFLDVRDPTDIKQVGYWVPTKGETWSVLFPPTDPTGEIVYALDFARGIDVLRFDRSDLRPRSAPVRRSWLRGRRGPADGRTSRTGLSRSGRFGYVCRLPVPTPSNAAPPATAAPDVPSLPPAPIPLPAVLP